MIEVYAIIVYYFLINVIVKTINFKLKILLGFDTIINYYYFFDYWYYYK